jgi:hypothetical protein
VRFGRNYKQNNRKNKHIDIGRGRGTNEGKQILPIQKHEGSEQRGAEWPNKKEYVILQVDAAYFSMEMCSYFYI